MKTLRQPHPSIERLFLGYLLAPLVPALLLVLGNILFNDDSAEIEIRTVLGVATSIVLLFGYPAFVFVGVPTYLVLHRFLRPRLVTFALVGGFVAALPLSLLLIDPRSNESGQLEGLGTMVAIFVLGSIGGVVFWLCTIWRNPAMVRAPDDTGSTSASAPGA